MKLRDVKNGEWVGFDLDRTLAKYDSFSTFDIIGDPIPEMVTLAKAYVDRGDEVKIFTARVSGYNSEEDKAKTIEAIQNWTEKYIGKRLDVTNCKDIRTAFYYDDIAIQVLPNSGKTLEDLCTGD